MTGEETKNDRNELKYVSVSCSRSSRLSQCLYLVALSISPLLPLLSRLIFFFFFFFLLFPLVLGCISSTCQPLVDSVQLKKRARERGVLTVVHPGT